MLISARGTQCVTRRCSSAASRPAAAGAGTGRRHRGREEREVHRRAPRELAVARAGAGVPERAGHRHRQHPTRPRHHRAVPPGCALRPSAVAARSPMGAVRADSRWRRRSSHGTRLRRSCRCSDGTHSVCDLRPRFLALQAGASAPARIPIRPEPPVGGRIDCDGTFLACVTPVVIPSERRHGKPMGAATHFRQASCAPSLLPGWPCATLHTRL